jgi:hypothetical protein
VAHVRGLSGSSVSKEPLLRVCAHCDETRHGPRIRDGKQLQAAR